MKGYNSLPLNPDQSEVLHGLLVRQNTYIEIVDQMNQLYPHLQMTVRRVKLFATNRRRRILEDLEFYEMFGIDDYVNELKFNLHHAYDVRHFDYMPPDLRMIFTAP